MAEAQSKRTISLITNGGMIDDAGVTQYTYEAVVALATALDFSIEVTEDGGDAVSTALQNAVANDVAVIVTIGEMAGKLAAEQARSHEDPMFITVDYPAPPERVNMRSVVFDSQRIKQFTDQITEYVESYVEMGSATNWQRVRARLLDWNLQAALVPFLAILTALIIGAVVIAAFDPEVWAAFNTSFGSGIGAAFRSIGAAYSAMFEGAFGNPVRMVSGLSIYISTGNDTDLLRAISPLMESLRISTPYIFTGLGVAIGFRSGLFNIGAEGQYFIGGLASVFVGYAVTGVPWFIHLPLAIGAGFLGGALWSAIAGFLKAKTGAHEVINTIMLNYIAFRFADYMLQVGGPMARPGDNRPVSPEVLPSAWLPQFFPGSVSIRVNMGLFLALAMVWVVWYILFKTTFGFELRTVGSNPSAARTAGMSVPRSFIAAMGLSGGVAGLAGAHDILGVTRFMPNAFAAGYGFDAIAIALLGKSHPVGVLLASLLFGFLRAGAQRMQGVAQVPIDIISVLQGLIIIFIAAPELVRIIYRLRSSGKSDDEVVITRGWGSV